MPYSETLATRRAAASQEKGGQWGEGWRMNVCGVGGRMGRERIHSIMASESRRVLLQLMQCRNSPKKDSRRIPLG